MIPAADDWTDAGPDLWRGCANAWECDEMGHQNVRFYVSRAMEGLRELLARHGIPVRPSVEAIAARPVTHHLRLMRENRGGTPLHLRGGFVSMGAGVAAAALTLYHSETDEVSATFLVELEARESHGCAAPRWPTALAEAPLHECPELCRPRGLTGPPPFAVGASEADALGMILTGAGIVADDVCDPAGLLRPESFIAFFADSTRTLTNAFHRAAEALPGAPQRIGSAGVECRLRYHRFPRAGDRYVMRGGLSELTERGRKTLYWMLDRETGAPLAELEAVELLLDLDSRRSFRLEGTALESLRHHVVGAAGVSTEYQERTIA